MAFDKLYVNGELYRQDVDHPSTDEILNISKEEKFEMQNIFLHTGNTISELGSSFTATASTVENVRDVRQMYKKILMQPSCASAAHNILAYRYGDSTNNRENIQEGFIDDGEHGAGAAVLRCLKLNNIQNTAVVVTRIWSGNKIGPRRFKLIEDATKSVLSKMAGAI